MGDFWLGIIGVAVGVAVSSTGQFLIDHFRHKRETKAQRELDDRRKKLLKVALENPQPDNEWRDLSTLSRIIDIYVPHPRCSPATRSGLWRGALAEVSQQAAIACGRARNRARPDETSEC